MKNNTFVLWVPLLFFLACDGNKYDPAVVKQRLATHVKYLASDELEGRETGSNGENMAAEYIEKSFREIGLSPKGTDGFRQAFDFLKGKSFKTNVVKFEDKTLVQGDDYFVMNFSGNGQAEGIPANVGYGIQAPDLNLDDYASLEADNEHVFLIDVSSPDGIHPHSKYKAYHDLRNRVKIAEKMGAKAVVLYNPGSLASDPLMNYDRKMDRVEIPVIFLKKHDLVSKGAFVSIHVEMEDAFAQGKNVVGFLDKKAPKTAIIGAHYDHLGYGGSGSLFRGDSLEIHNGADDNASGTSLLIELARTLHEKEGLKYNVLFIAFSGEEKGLLGSAHYADNPTIALEEVKFMINMDMVGRLDEENTLTLLGTGTSPVWDTLVDRLAENRFNLVKKTDGIGPSDHTSFYLEDIPVLHFFTGAHEDYHKPSDDFELINVDGMLEVYSYILNILEATENIEIAFSKTKDSDNSNAPRFSVTLGVIPDYAFNGKGMRIDGVTEGKPAFKAGLLKGDVVVKMGDIEVVDMMAYMNALALFKKGDSTSVVVSRGGKELYKNVVF